MLCCGGGEDENFGQPINQYTAPPNGNAYGAAHGLTVQIDDQMDPP